MPGNDWGEIFYNVFVIYLFLTLVQTCYSVIRMYIVKHFCNGVKYGKMRIKQLTSEGRFRQLPVYSLDEIYEDKDLGTVRLSVFPNDTGERTKYVLILPGGGYAHCVTKEEGYPIAAKFNEMGYTVFVLEYRTGFNCTPYAPMEDVSRAIKHIEEHQEEYNIDPEGYALCGFSAGGNLAGIYASHNHGYEQYGTRRPATIMLGYPWTNMQHWLDHPYWNIWKGIMGVWLSERGFIYMFGRSCTREKRDSLCVQKQVTDDYTPTYMFSGGRDVLVPASHHAEVLVDALEKHHVKYCYRRFFALPHGIGLGLGTGAENWICEAVDFWQENVKEDNEIEDNK